MGLPHPGDNVSRAMSPQEDTREPSLETPTDHRERAAVGMLQKPRLTETDPPKTVDSDVVAWMTTS